MLNNGIVNIHGKEYMTVARRLELAHEQQTLEQVNTEVLSHDPVVIKATVQVNGRSFTGISSVSLDTGKTIERQNPYEVAETSAVGRALGFAGYGLIESVASADDMVKALRRHSVHNDRDTSEIQERTCVTCGAVALERKGKTKAGKEYHGIFCTSNDKSHSVWL